MRHKISGSMRDFNVRYARNSCNGSQHVKGKKASAEGVNDLSVYLNHGQVGYSCCVRSCMTMSNANNSKNN